MSGTAVAGKHVPPMAATLNKKKLKWHPVDIAHGVICVKGGFSREYMQASCLEIANSETRRKETFVRLAKNDHWFLKGVAGPGTQKGELKAVTVMEDLRAELERRWVSQESEAEPKVAAEESAVAAKTPAVAETSFDSQDAHEDVDPMEALDEVENIHQKSPKGSKKTA